MQNITIKMIPTLSLETLFVMFRILINLSLIGMLILSETHLGNE